MWINPDQTHRSRTQYRKSVREAIESGCIDAPAVEHEKSANPIDLKPRPNAKRLLSWVLLAFATSFCIVVFLGGLPVPTQPSESEYNKSLNLVSIAQLDSGFTSAVAEAPFCSLLLQQEAQKNLLGLDYRRTPSPYSYLYALRGDTYARVDRHDRAHEYLTLATAPEGGNLLVEKFGYGDGNSSVIGIRHFPYEIRCARFDRAGALYFTGFTSEKEPLAARRFKLFRVTRSGKPVEVTGMDLDQLPAIFTGDFAFDQNDNMVLALNDKYRFLKDPITGRNFYAIHGSSKRFVLVRPKGRDCTVVSAFTDFPRSWDLDNDGNLVFINNHFCVGRYSAHGLERFAAAPFSPICISATHTKR